MAKTAEGGISTTNSRIMGNRHQTPDIRLQPRKGKEERGETATNSQIYNELHEGEENKLQLYFTN